MFLLTLYLHWKSGNRKSVVSLTKGLYDFDLTKSIFKKCLILHIIRYCGWHQPRKKTGEIGFYQIVWRSNLKKNAE